MAVTLECGARRLVLDRPRVMGILNLTPDSFSDGGKYLNPDLALRHAIGMVDAGADLIDVGGESTRPGAELVGEQQELDRVIPVIEQLRSEINAVISIDTSKAVVMSEAAKAGAGLINDVRALQEPNAAKAAAETGLPVCLMHMKGQPATMQASPSYQDVVGEVVEFLKQRTRELVSLGVPQQQILWDPGFGFGKTAEHNLQLVKGIARLAEHAEVLVGLSKKRLFGEILKNETADRTVASVTAATFCVQQGARIARVHDVQQTVDALKVWEAVELGRVPE